jgi:hypothetical protein
VSSIKVWKIPSPSSPSSLDENQAHIASEIGKDIPSSDETYPHQSTISSPENGENRAQNGAGEDSEGSEDIIPTLLENDHKTIYRLGHSDEFACPNCKKQGDRWFMEQHECRRGNGN